MKKILVVDDSDTVRQLVRQALLPAGYDILEAFDGLDGLNKIRSHTDLSAVLCDVNMPNMNGLEMIANVHSDGCPHAQGRGPPRTRDRCPPPR